MRPDPRFASDNAAGAHPLILEALAEANAGAALAYGADPWTSRCEARIREVLEAPDAVVRLVFAGTGANVLAMRLLTSRVSSVLCADAAHLRVAETGAPEAVVGVPLVPVPSVQGKLTPSALRAAVPADQGMHAPRPSVVSLTQATELGTVYTPDELRALCDAAHGLGLTVHLDGARLPHAAAALGCSLADLTTHAGVDVVSFGGAKAGLLFGEAVVCLDPAHARDIDRHRKQITQLYSKMRFCAVQLLALLEGERWRGWCQVAHARARRLAERVEGLPGVRVEVPVQTNAVFARLPEAAVARLQEDHAFAVWSPGREPLVRWMCAFDTSEAAVDAFADAVARAVAEGATGDRA